MQCPKCNVEMDEVRKLDVVIDSCSRCGGVWLDRGELEKLRSISSDYSGHKDERDYDRNAHHGSDHYKGHKKKKKAFNIFDIFD